MMPIQIPHTPLLRLPLDGDRPWLVAGVLSGTSADGIDVVLAEVRIDAAGSGGAGPILRGLDQRAFATLPYPELLGSRVRAILAGEAPSLAEIATLHVALGEAFGGAAAELARREGLGPLALVASHGQTVWHHDGEAQYGKATLQLGDGDAVAEAAGCAAATDFRARDCAAGGEGAPLVSLVDDVLFRAAPRPLALLNLGGISNWTLLGEGSAAPVAFDSGPAGALLDVLAKRLLGVPYDDGGREAALGTVLEPQLDGLMGHPFLAQDPPKSTGRDTFSEAWVAGFLGECAGAKGADILATAVRFVARCAMRDLFQHGAHAALDVAIGGGGVHNIALMGALRAEWDARSGGREPRTFGTTGAFGVPPDAREALAFAALGARLALGEPSTQTAATGAKLGRILGKWSPSAR